MHTSHSQPRSRDRCSGPWIPRPKSAYINMSMSVRVGCIVEPEAESLEAMSFISHMKYSRLSARESREIRLCCKGEQGSIGAVEGRCLSLAMARLHDDGLIGCD